LRDLRPEDFFYHLPPDLIAQRPTAERDQSRLLVYRRNSQTIEHKLFTSILSEFREGDILTLNNSRVIPARLRGEKRLSKGQIEVFLLEENGINDWWVMLRPGRRARPGTLIEIFDLAGAKTLIQAEVVEKNAAGHARLQFSGATNVLDHLPQIGEIPLPPYIQRETPNLDQTDLERYQTVYAAAPGSVAAPTAGLHFTEELLEKVRKIGVRVCYVTLHVGLGTFAPIKADTIDNHVMHTERFSLGAETARIINEARRNGQRVFAVGTTTVRTLETIGHIGKGRLFPTVGKTNIFIYPPFKFKIVDCLITNFHLPQSTLLMLISAFSAPEQTIGRKQMLMVYEEAIRRKYRFFSYGDAMLIT
jgi:S-adenosylmethionine:tRNA ribosyltransferase-isomerase